MKIGFYFPSRHIGTWNWEAFLSGELPLSGTDSQVLNVTYLLAGRGHDVFFYSTQAPSPVERLKHVQVESLCMAARRAKETKLDILIFNNRDNEETRNGALECESLKQPCIAWDQNGPWHEMADLFWQLEVVRRVVCVSAYQADCSRDHPVFNKIEVMHNSVDPEEFTPYHRVKKDPRHLCYLGSLTPTKGFQHLAKVWPTVHNAFPEARLTVLGSRRLYERHARLGMLGVASPEFEISAICPYLGATKEEARDKNILFLGLASPKKVREVVASCGIGVVNSDCSTSFETFCVSALEVQAGGAAVVGANRLGLKETVKSKETGVLINSEKELAGALIRLLSDPGRTTSMGAEGKRWVEENFTHDIILSRWDALLEGAIKGLKPHPPPFSWRRFNTKVLLRECIRKTRNIPFLGHSVPTLRVISNRRGGKIRKAHNGRSR